MNSITDKEVLGDWSNLKGTRYHLVYALWLLLKRRASSVRFFDGNDLTASPIAPPGDVASGALVSASAAGADPNTDVWIQLKATRDVWTVSALLDENLLFNFICNAAASERAGRRWVAALVTEAELQQDKVKAFAEEPATAPQNERKLRDVIDRTQAHLKTGGITLTTEQVEGLALKVLALLASTESLHLATIKAEVETELAFALPDRAAARRVAGTLVGGMLLGAGAGPTVLVYDAEWVNREAGFAVLSDLPFDVDVPSACDTAVADVTGSHATNPFHSHRCAGRPRLTRTLDQFLSSRATLFALTGRSGAGKTWAVSNWVCNQLAGKVRVFVPGSEFLPGVELANLAAQALGRLSARSWTPQAVLAKIAAAASDPGRGPLVFVIDDLRVTADSAGSYRDGLVRLVRDARRWNAKVVVTCQSELWAVFGLHLDLPRAEVFGLAEVADAETDAGPGAEKRRSSYALEDFAPTELADAISRRMPADRAAVVLGYLRQPAFARLRNPYLLDRYLEQSGAALTQAGHPPESVETDRLLSTVVDARIERVAAALQTDAATVRTALDTITDELWVRRRQETLSTVIIRRLADAVPGFGLNALGAFRCSGFLTVSGAVSWSEGLVADHVFASRLLDRLGRGAAALDELDPEHDATVTESVIRVAPNGAELADRLLRRDARYRPAVVRGLAARSVEDPVAVLSLRALTRPTDEYIADPDGCEALGTMAARGHSGRTSCSAWRYAATLYLSGDPHESLRGAQALGAAFRYVPRRVARLVHSRVRSELARTTRRNELGRRLKTALLPLLDVAHREAADLATSTVESLTSSLAPHPSTDVEDVVAVQDEIRGRAALFQAPAALERLLEELGSAERGTRLRSATAIRSLVFEAPERVVAGVCQRLREEADPEVAVRLVWASYPLISVNPDAWLESFSASRVARWTDPVPAGAALSMLGAVAGHRPEAALRLLPRELSSLPPWARACVSQVHALAWWECAVHRAEAYDQLAVLSRPALCGVPRTFHVFAYRGAFIARLGVLTKGRLTPEGVTVSMTSHRDGQVPYCYVDTEEFLRRHARSVSSSGESRSLLELLRECVRTDEAFKINSARREALANARFSCARAALDDLCVLASQTADPLSEIRDLPRNWQAVRAARRLLELGITSADVIAFAQQTCDELASSAWMNNARHERGRCLAELARHTGSPAAVIAAPEPIRGVAAMWLGIGESDSQRVARVIDDTPEQMLSLLELAVPTPDHIPELFHWSKLARGWRAVALSGVYRRMFSAETIGRLEAIGLIDEVLLVVRSLPDSPERAEHEALYATLRSWLDGRPVPAALPGTSATSPIRASLAWASKFLDDALGALWSKSPWDCRAAVLDARYWWQSHSHHIEDDVLSYGSGLKIYLITTLPALRLAGVAIGLAFGARDPAGAIMSERHAVLSALNTLDGKYHDGETRRDRLEAQLSEARRLAERFPDSERVLRVLGNLELRLGCLAEAERSLRRCLNHPLCASPTRAGALYDLACVAAREGRADECRDHLTACLALDKRHREQIGRDPDFDGVKDTEWFKEMGAD